MDENYKYASHMISWLEKLGVPNSKIAEDTFILLKSYWLDQIDCDLEKLKDKLWDWLDTNDGYNFESPQVAKMRMLLCLTSKDNRELKDTGFFEDMLNKLGITYEEANKDI